MMYTPEDYRKAAAFLRTLAGEEHSGQLERIAAMLEWRGEELKETDQEIVQRTIKQLWERLQKTE